MDILKLSIKCIYLTVIISIIIPTKCTYTIIYIYIYIVNTTLHVSALMAPSSRRDLSYALNYCYITTSATIL